MGRTGVHLWTVKCILVTLLMSTGWMYLLLQRTTRAHTAISKTALYEKLEWIFHNTDGAYMGEALAHFTHEEQMLCVEQYLQRSSKSDHHKMETLCTIASMQKEDVQKKALLARASAIGDTHHSLLLVVAQTAPSLLPLAHALLKEHSPAAVTAQSTIAYEYALQHDNPTLFNVLMEHDIPLTEPIASAFLKTVLVQQKHQAFVPLLVRAGADTSFLACHGVEQHSVVWNAQWEHASSLLACAKYKEKQPHQKEARIRAY